jgi:hypothetical protein
MDGTWKGVDKPGGAHYYTPPSSENPINDCPGCKYGTLEATPDKTIKCIDCDREYTPEELHNLGLIPQERRVRTGALGQRDGTILVRPCVTRGGE